MRLNVPEKANLVGDVCAGCAALSVRQKVDVCEGLGLSPLAAIALLLKWYAFYHLKEHDEAMAIC